MTVHLNVWGTRPTMHMHAWSDGGGSYATVIELDADGAPWRVTLIGDAVDTYSHARVLNAAPDAVAAFIAEYASAKDYAAAYAGDAREVAAFADVHDDDYVIVSHGIVYAVRMFGASEDV